MQPLQELQSFDFVKNITAKNKKLLEQGLQISSFEKGRIVLRKGDRISGAFLVVTGRLRVYTISESGQEGTLYTLKPGNTCVFALTCVFNEMLYPAWVEAEAASRVAIVPGATFKSLFNSEPAVHRFMFDALASLAFDLTLNLDRLMTSNLETRLASFLLTRSSLNGEIRMSHENIANQLGTAREVVSRQLKIFRERKWVTTQRGMVKVTNSAALAAFLENEHPFS